MPAVCAMGMVILGMVYAGTLHTHKMPHALLLCAFRTGACGMAISIQHSFVDTRVDRVRCAG